MCRSPLLYNLPVPGGETVGNHVAVTLFDGAHHIDTAVIQLHDDPLVDFRIASFDDCRNIHLAGAQREHVDILVEGKYVIFVPRLSLA